ncbi:NUDIX hydrolase [Halorubrum sp. N11]|uniref:NUDIX hydrolase n=1 Tax=Halorubrum sp. N11 TaxID=3402276 RepID=UPI003EBAA1A0
MADEHLQATVSVRGIVVEPRGRLLILQRSTDTEWELPGGRLGPDEDPMQGLKRELTEETGLPVEIDDIVAANSWVNTDNQDRFAVHYRCYAPQEKPTLSNEHSDAQWTTRSAIDNLLSEPQIAAIHAATGSVPVQSEAADRSSPSPK